MASTCSRRTSMEGSISSPKNLATSSPTHPATTTIAQDNNPLGSVVGESVTTTGLNNNVNNSSFNQFRSVINSQKQLRVYIENLEAKLNNLKNEMDTGTVVVQQQQGSNPNERKKSSTSNESLDSIKEFSSKQQTRHSNQIPNNKTNESINGMKPNNDDDDDEDILARMQQHSRGGLDDQSTDDDNENNNKSGDRLLQKSLHKSNLTDLYFSKLRAAAPQYMIAQPQFSPIDPSTSQQQQKQKHRSTTLTDDLGALLTASGMSPRQQQLINPKPIKLSSTPSSSSDSTVITSGGGNGTLTNKINLKLDASFGGVGGAGDETNNSSPLTSARLISSTSSRIWNKVQPSSTTTSTSSSSSSTSNNNNNNNLLFSNANNYEYDSNKNRSSSSKWSNILCSGSGVQQSTGFEPKLSVVSTIPVTYNNEKSSSSTSSSSSTTNITSDTKHISK